MTAKKKTKNPSLKQLLVKEVTPVVNWSKKNFKEISGLRRKPVTILIPLVVIVFGLLGFLLKDKFLVAIVNGKPIFRSELSQRLTSSYGKETLENLIVERLIQEEAGRRQIAVTEKEIDEEVDKISRSLGEGTKIEEVLALQGISLKDFRQQLKIRLQVNRILEKEITITDEEVNKYLKENSASMTASGEAERKAEAQGIIKEQKINEKIQTWVADLLKAAKINRFLK